MIFSLDIRRARKGDCLLLHFGTKAKPGLVMIDGGPAQVYHPHLEPRIDQIRAARGLEDDQPLLVDVLMVSHVDDDHIRGILDLTKELIEKDDADQPLPVRVLSFWHNSFDNIIDKDGAELTANLRKEFVTASTGSVPKEATVDVDDPDISEEVIMSNLKVLASIVQGAQLRKDAEKLSESANDTAFRLNPNFGGDLAIAKAGGKAIKIGGKLTFTVAGPMLPEIEELRQMHNDWLKELKKKGLSPDEALAAYVDKSVPNLSSIVVLAESEGHSILLTGDARGDKIIEGLQLIKKLKKTEPLHVDILKVPHHGSANNLTQDFFERITADHYVFSGNGEHGNPERQALEMLLAARGTAKYQVHLTYPVKDIDKDRKKDWDKERAKEQKKKVDNPDKKVRAAWSPAKNSLAAMLDANPKFKAKVRTIDGDDEAHVIDLGDPLGKAWPDLA